MAVSSKGFDKRREKIRVEMCKHQSLTVKYRRKLEAMDFQQDKVLEKKLLGNCFALKSDSVKRAGQSGYCRVDSFDGDSPRGILIHNYRKGNVNVEINSPCLFKDWILNGKKIPHSQFNKYLRMAKKELKEKNGLRIHK